MALVPGCRHRSVLARHLHALLQRRYCKRSSCGPRWRRVKRRHWLALLLLAGLLRGVLPAEVKRVVVIKLDGVPHDVLERELEHLNPATGKSSLPWMDRIFALQGTRLENFYVRAISLSAPSWSTLDTGLHLQIRGNAEFDRYTYHVYDYLNLFPFYL